ncbi:VapE domain-containing protein [Erythrobacter aureus]|uniref:Virulence-associated protein E-like domain-containing protein n=1 Tax=Erythrobacter aureus TaxID=2182384 RepID=A0A345YAU2_9SPHN|nr:VapE domain-containing protein [Erythrobacter aureus]AXK41044.1 hypothetical protein DVR09_00710 [Erythrobacter aureus]
MTSLNRCNAACGANLRMGNIRHMMRELHMNDSNFTPQLPTISRSQIQKNSHSSPFSPASFSTAKQPRSKAVKLVQLLQAGILGTVRWDEFISAAVLDRSGTRTILDENEIFGLVLECEVLGLERVASSDFGRILTYVAKQNRFDSAQERLARLPTWDGIKRIERFLHTHMGVDDTPYSRAVARYIWSSMVARLVEPGCKADMMPVLVGAQGTGKSEVLKRMALDQSHYVDVRLADRPNDLVQTVFGRSLLIWEEQQGVKGKSDFDRAKTFLSREYLEVRSAAKRIGNDRYPCRHVVFGTSTSSSFLRDPGGHRRFLPLSIGEIDLRLVEADIFQLWAEGLHMVLQRQQLGKSLVDYKEAEQRAKAEHKNYLKQARWVDDAGLSQWLDRQQTPFSTADALEAIGFDSKATLREKREMADSLRQLGYVQKRKRVHGQSLDRWRKDTAH